MLKKLAANPGIFDGQCEFRFSETMKHTGVQLSGENSIKSIEGYNYHFGLMEPCISEKGAKPISVQFQVK